MTALDRRGADQGDVPSVLYCHEPERGPHDFIFFYFSNAFKGYRGLGRPLGNR